MVRKQDGGHIAFNDPNKKKITLIREQFHADVDESTKTETVHELDNDGNLFLTLDIAKNESSFSLKVKHSTSSFRDFNNYMLFLLLFSDNLCDTRNRFRFVLYHSLYGH